MDLTSVYAIATALGIITLALTEIVKKAFNINPRYLPLLSFFVGIGLGLASAPIHEASIAHLAWGGGIAGLVASGAFDAAKQILSKKEDDK